MNLSELDTSTDSLLYLSLLLISLDNKKTFHPELLFVLNSKDFITISHLLGGRQVKIPSIVELRLSMLTVLYYYCIKILKWGEEKFRKTFFITKPEIKKIINGAKKLEEYILVNNLTIPEVYLTSNTKWLKNINESFQRMT